MKIISFIFTILLFVSLVYSIDPIIIKFRQPIVDTYASSKCQPTFNVLVEYSESLPQYSFSLYVDSTNSYYPSLINGSSYLFSFSSDINIGKNQSVSFQLRDTSVYPALTWDFNNYTRIDCDPLPTNLTIKSKQSSWVSTKGLWSLLYWQQMVEVQGLNKSIPYDAFICTVPQPFNCLISEYLNGPKITNFIVQVYISKSNIPFTRFNVIIADKQGRVLLNSPFDGLSSPANPPPSISNLQSYPSNNATVIKGEMLNNAFYLMNILNKNTICGIASSNDYFIQNTLIPMYGTPANATYIGFNILDGNSPLTSHVQIIDNQGVKRVGSDNIINFNYKQYENQINNPTVSYYQNTNSIQSLVNVKADVSYNPDTYLNPGFYQVDTPNYLRYPYGYSNGTVQYHSISVTLQISKYNQGPNYSYLVIVSQNGPNGASGYQYLPITTFNNITENKLPQILKVETVPISFRKVLTRVHAKDLESGVSYIYYTNLNKVTSADLVYGDQYDGVYELVETFDTYYGLTKPTVSVYDNAGNNIQVTSHQPIYNTNFDLLPEYPLYKFVKNTPGLDPFNITQFEFKYNDVDVSNGKFNNTLCFNFAGSIKTMVPRFLLFPYLLNTEKQQIDDAIPGAWNDVKSMFCMDFTIPARVFTGDVLYGIFITPFVYDSYYLASTIGTKAQLRVTSSFGDQMPPIITEFAAYPSNNVQITQNTNIGWNIRIEDSPNGLLSAEFNITSDYDLQPYTIKITPSNATSGNSNSGTYQLRIPINSNTCRSQSFRISSASITDSQGHTSILPSNLNLNPLYRFLDSPQLILNITCPQAVVDNSPPILTSFTSSVDTIDVGTYKDFRNITFTIKTSDSGSGISLRHNPIVYLNSKAYDQISQVSTLLSNSNGISTYTATVQLPYGYGSYQGILISIYGIVDNQLNINGYSSTDLQSLGFQSSIKVTYSNSPVLDSTSSINSTGTSLTIYGHKFGIDQSKLTLQIDYQNNQGWKNTSISFFSGIILMTNSITPTSTPFYVRVIVDGKVSNSILVVPSIIDSPCKYEVLQSVVATWINSEKYHYLQASITIKNVGSRPIKLFSYVMDNIDQIWGVTVNGNRYTLPSYNEIINPYDQYSFGYIIKGTTVGELNQITYTCL